LQPFLQKKSTFYSVFLIKQGQNAPILPLFAQNCPTSTPLDGMRHMLITKAPCAKLFHPKLFGCAFKTLATLETIVTQAPLGSKQKKGCVTMSVKRGDIYYADLSPVIGSEQGGLRPVLIVQNDIGNRYSPTVIAAAITSRMSKAKLPTHIDIFAGEVGLAKDSVILLEQIRTLDKRRLKEKMGHLDDAVMNHVNTAIAISFGLGTP
jgi:mRNA interferase MazF